MTLRQLSRPQRSIGRSKYAESVEHTPSPDYRLKASHAEIELRLREGACLFAFLSAEARRSLADGARSGRAFRQ
jgi:hypothetical protein